MAINKLPKEKSNAKALENLSISTRKRLILFNIELKLKSTTDKYDKRKKSHVDYFQTGYDMMQFNIVVRPYLMKKHNIKKSIELDILLYLFPIQFFVMSDFKELPTTKHEYTVSKLIELGYVEVLVPVKKREIYTLTDYAERIVKDYYMYLSGEKTIYENARSNPFKGKDVAKVDRVREKLMIKLKKQSERNPEKFKGKLY